jgi:hypothetical protein
MTVQEIVVPPEGSLPLRLHGRLSGMLGVRVHGQGIVAVLEAYGIPVQRQERVDHRRRARAEGAFEVAELDNRDDGFAGPSNRWGRRVGLGVRGPTRKDEQERELDQESMLWRHERHGAGSTPREAAGGWWG